MVLGSWLFTSCADTGVLDALGFLPEPSRYALCFLHLQPLLVFQDLNKVVTLGCDLFNGFECFASLPLENDRLLQSALLQKEALKA